jgi:hypothetical protein
MGELKQINPKIMENWCLNEFVSRVLKYQSKQYKLSSNGLFLAFSLKPPHRCTPLSLFS